MAMKPPASSTTRSREQVQLVTNWLEEIEQAKKREKAFRKDGEKIVKIYDGTSSETTPFNILFSNTETLSPALYSAVPRPVVERRYEDDDPIGKASSLAAERLLTFQLDTNLDGYDTFDDVMKMAVLDALLPGRATTCVKYDAAFLGTPAPDSSEEQDETKTETEDAPDYLDHEQLCLEAKVWNRVYYGYAKHWSGVPWIAFEDYIDKEEATRLFTKEVADEMVFTGNAEDAQNAERRGRSDDDRHQGLRKTACIYQIWDKDGGKKVRYISAAYPFGYLKVQDDPLELSGFYNCPRPLQFIDKAHTLLPTAPYTLYQNQAMELNRLTKRIMRIVEAIKARGVYDGELGGDLANLMKADDNELVPAEKGASIAAEKGLGNAIWFMPVEMLVATVTQLYQARESCKQVIYEITGIADIMRGNTKASETLGAQKIKNSWGTLRIKNKQKEVQRYVRDLLRIILEIAATKFSEETWATMTGLPYLTEMQVQQMTAQMQAMQQQQLSQPPMPGQPPAPPDPQLQAMQQQMQTPKWSDILGLLKNDLQRAYRIDIETNSTIEPEATEDQQQITEIMTAIGQVMNGIAPLVKDGILPFESAKVMLITIARRFRFGRELETTLQQMQPPQPQNDGAAQAAQAKVQQQGAEQALQLKSQQADLALQQKTMTAEKTLLEKSIDLELREIQLKADEEKFAMAKQMAEQELSVKDEASRNKLQGDQKIASLEAGKYKTENVVNQKADSALGKGVSEMKAIVQQLMQAISSQADQHAQMLQGLTTALTAPKTRKAVRDKQGRIESVTEEVSG